ncbi:hypothetical protein IEQ34_014277 [Dendrobium chrysotoxum]|uniref:Uncharacterized protein n=1 Tax=Dendrobium chrysotoxum TaxID=161865 RepID=A0AAV7GJJ2_DENCH|nr:hypothetical protein IEQ34_014277 [Dendrobium chrysotoxum]
MVRGQQSHKTAASDDPVRRVDVLDLAYVKKSKGQEIEALFCSLSTQLKNVGHRRDGFYTKPPHDITSCLTDVIR